MIKKVFKKLFFYIIFCFVVSSVAFAAIAQLDGGDGGSGSSTEPNAPIPLPRFEPGASSLNLGPCITDSYNPVHCSNHPPNVDPLLVAAGKVYMYFGGPQDLHFMFRNEPGTVAERLNAKHTTLRFGDYVNCLGTESDVLLIHCGGIPCDHIVEVTVPKGITIVNAKADDVKGTHIIKEPTINGNVLTWNVPKNAILHGKIEMSAPADMPLGTYVSRLVSVPTTSCEFKSLLLTFDLVVLPGHIGEAQVTGQWITGMDFGPNGGPLGKAGAADTKKKFLYYDIGANSGGGKMTFTVPSFLTIKDSNSNVATWNNIGGSVKTLYSSSFDEQIAEAVVEATADNGETSVGRLQLAFLNKNNLKSDSSWSLYQNAGQSGGPTTIPPLPPNNNPEICGDGIDNNNNGQIDENCGTTQHQQGYRSSESTCYDTSHQIQGDQTTCKTVSQWHDLAKSFCQGKCNTAGDKCGVNTFSVSNQCTT